MLLVWGTEDLFLTKQLAEMSRHYANDLTIKYVDGASHWVQQDSPNKVNSIIAEFLNLQS